jgi:hypothetical protein
MTARIPQKTITIYAAERQGDQAREEAKRRDKKAAEDEAAIHAGKSVNSKSVVTP